MGEHDSTSGVRSVARRVLGVAWRLVPIGVYVYAAGILAVVFLRAVTGDRLWTVFAASTGLHLLLLPAFPLTAALLVRGLWRPALASGLGVALFLWSFGELFVPLVPDVFAGEEPCRRRVMTLNAGAGRTDPERLTAALRDSGAQVVALQELTRAQVRAIETELDELYPHRFVHGGATSRKAILSRYPLLSRRVHRRGDIRLHAIEALLDTSDSDEFCRGDRLRVLVAHPPRPSINRRGVRPHPRSRAQLAVLAELATSRGRTLMLGDFNLADQTAGYELLAGAGLGDAFREAGFGFGATWPARRGARVPVERLVRIDYVWHTPDIEAERAWVGGDVGSDHLPVLAEIR